MNISAESDGMSQIIEASHGVGIIMYATIQPFLTSLKVVVELSDGPIAVCTSK